MKYTVVWTPSALDRLAELWNEATDQAALSQASDEIDLILARDPSRQGEAREASTRILIRDPLAVYFSVSEDDRMVTVFAVWRWSR